MSKVSFGILSTANIGLNKVIPAMQKGKLTEVNAIASRDIRKAEEAAKGLNIPKYYGSYEALLADKEIDAVYIPLPNHLHIEWAEKAMEAGKHILCEKPLAMSSEEAEDFLEWTKKYPKLKVMEAFMYRHHPQIQKSKQLINDGAIGEVRNIHTMFSYHNVNPDDIRNQSDIGGGGLMDIGCYCISISRLMFGGEPKRVFASIDFDPEMKIDRLVSAVLEFESGTSNFSCSTQMYNNQFAIISGTKGRIKLDMPFTPGPNDAAKIVHYSGNSENEITFDPCDQYTIQGDLFAKAVLEDLPVPTPLSDGAANMRVIDKLKESAESNAWVKL